MEFDARNPERIYQLLAGLAGFVVIMACFIVIMAPFFSAILLATILTLATWPAFTWLNQRLGHRPAPAAFLMTCALACCFIFPLIMIGTSVADNFTKVYDAVQASLGNGTKGIEESLKSVPYIGEYLSQGWSIIANDRAKLAAQLQEYAAPTSEKLIALGGKVGRGIFDVTLGVLITYFFFRHGVRFTVRLTNLVEHFSGERGQHLFTIAKKTLVGVIYGILGTALAQAAFAALGFWIAGVPGASFLGLLTFFLSLIPMGPPLIWIPAALWLYGQGDMTWAIFLVLWGTFVISSIDNFLKPYFISLGSDLPLLLVLLGIFGGVMAFGFIGVFIGPTILAVVFSLIIEWSSGREKKITP